LEGAERERELVEAGRGWGVFAIGVIKIKFMNRFIESERFIPEKSWGELLITKLKEEQLGRLVERPTAELATMLEAELLEEKSRILHIARDQFEMEALMNQVIRDRLGKQRKMEKRGGGPVASVATVEGGHVASGEMGVPFAEESQVLALGADEQFERQSGAVREKALRLFSRLNAEDLAEYLLELRDRLEDYGEQAGYDLERRLVEFEISVLGALQKDEQAAAK
jgi:hypothetical protein